MKLLNNLNFFKKHLYKMSTLILVSIIVGLLVYIYTNMSNNNNNNNNNKILNIQIHDLNRFKLDTIVNHKAMEISNPALYYDFDMINKPLPKILDLRSKCPPVYDQGLLGTCTNQSNAFLYHYYCKNVLKNNFIPSRFFLDYSISKLKGGCESSYLNTDISISNIQADGGSHVFNNIGILAIDGVCNKHLYPYPNYYKQAKHQFINDKINEYKQDLSKLNNKPEELQKTLLKIQELSESNIYKPPSREAYIDAKKHTINNLNIYRIRHNLEDIKKCLNYIGPISFDMNFSKYIENILKYNDKNNLLKAIKILKEYLKNEKLNKNDRIYILKYIESINKKIVSPKNDEFISEKTFNKLYIKKIYPLFNQSQKKYFKDRHNYTLKFPTKQINLIKNTLKNYNIPINKLYNIRYIKQNYNIYLNSYDYIMNLANKYKDLKNMLNTINLINNPVEGHSMAIVGYDDLKKVFIIRNSWSDKWGDKGYFYMDYEYFINRDPLFGFNIGDMYAFGKL